MKTLLLILLIVFCQANSFASSFLPESFSANFEESYISAVNGKEKKSFGKIDYRYPSHIRFEKISPDSSTFVSNPQKSWYYVPPFVKGEKGEVTIQESNKLVLTKFLDSLKNGVENNKLFTHKYNKNELILTFTKAIQKDMNLKEATLIAGSDAKKATSMKEFERLVLIYNDGRRVNLKFTDLKEETKFSPKHFEFDIPSNTKVSEGK